MSSPSKRRDMDIMKLVMGGYEVLMTDTPSDFYVKFSAPADSLYSGGIYKVHVTLPATYPYKSPSIGFSNRIYHPNVDEASGSVCLDVINQTWSPMYDLVNVFAVFLPQLLLYPNPADPLNPQAASLMNKDFKAYSEKVRGYVRTYASTNFKLNEDDDDDDDEDTYSSKAQDIPNSNKMNNNNSISIASPTGSPIPSSAEPSPSTTEETLNLHKHHHHNSLDQDVDANDDDDDDDDDCVLDCMSEVDEPLSEIDDIGGVDEDDHAAGKLEL